MLEAMCRREAGLAARALGEYRRARSELERAVDLFARLDRAAWEIHALGNLATLSWYEGMPEQSLDLARHALERCASADMMLLRRLPLGDMGAAAMVLGAMELARQCLEESLALSQQAGDRAQELVSRTHLGWLAVRLRRPDEAESHFRAGLELAVAIRSCTEQSWLHAGFAETYRLAGRLPEASEHARRAVELAGASAAVYDQKLAHWVLRRLGEGDAKPVE
jgi:tetratricopeptide (TPR) repeat protein